MRRFWRTALTTLVKLAALGLSMLLVLGWMQSIHPAFDSFSHFRHIFAGLLLVVTLILVFIAPLKWAAGCVAVLATTIWLTSPYLPWTRLIPTEPEADTIRIVQFNMRFNNKQVEELARIIHSTGADVALLQEMTRNNIEILSRLKDAYPHQLECIAFSVGSVAMMSRFPLVPDTTPICSRFDGFLSARLLAGDRELTVANLHTKWPWPGEQAKQLDSLAERFSKLEKPAVLAGDFNAAPWSAAVRHVANLSGLTIVPGLKLTWRPRTSRSGSALPALLSLDQIMASEDLQPVRRWTIANNVSDHLPVITEFAWRP